MLTFRVLDDSGSLALHDGHSGVRGTQVNTDDLALDLLLAVDVLGIPSPESRCY